VEQGAISRMLEVAAIAVFVLFMGALIWRATRTLAANSIKLRETNDRFDVALANSRTGSARSTAMET